MTDNVVVLESSVEEKTLNFEGLRLLAVLTSPEARAAVSHFLAELDGVSAEILPPDEFAEQNVRIDGAPANVLILEAANPSEGAARIKAIRSAPDNANLQVCLLLKSPTKTAIVDLLRRGANEILSTKPSDVELSGMLARAATHSPIEAERSSSSSVRTIVFVHASGGSGATSLAVNSAVQLQKEAARLGGSACLIDFDIQFGDADLHLDLPVRSNLVDFIRAPDRLDQRMLENLMTPGPEGLHVLTAPDHPLPLDAISKEMVDKILTLARRHYRHVVVDMPIALTNWTDTVLRKADCVFLVTQVNVLALRSARRLVDTLQHESLLDLPIYGVANRYPSKGQERRISIAEAEKTLRIPIKAEIPSDFGLLINSLDQGVPASVQQPAAKFSKLVEDLLVSVDAKPASEAQRKPRRSFLNFGG